jgi:hypothetical protein
MSSTRILRFYPSLIKKSFIRLQPDSSNISNTDESKPSIADSVMIDNPADYERIFRAKAHLPRSPSRQEVPAQPTVPSSSSAGFAVQPAPTTELSSAPVAAAAKPKSPPPQVIFIRYLEKKLFLVLYKIDKLMPPIQMPNPSIIPPEPVN